MLNADWDKEIIRNIRVGLREEEGAAPTSEEWAIIENAKGFLSFQAMIGDEIYSLSAASFYGLALIHANLWKRGPSDEFAVKTVGISWNMALGELKKQAEQDESLPRPMICRELKKGLSSPENVWEPVDTVIPIDFQTFLKEYKKRRDAFESAHGPLNQWEPPKGKVVEILGRAYLGVDFEKARGYLIQASEEAPDKCKAWEALGDCLMRVDPPCYQEAENAFQKALDNLPEGDSLIQSDRCRIYFKLYEAVWVQGRHKEALQILERLALVDPAVALPEIVIRGYEIGEFEVSKRALARLSPSRSKEILSFAQGESTFEKMVQAVDMGRSITRARDAAFGEGPF